MSPANHGLPVSRIHSAGAKTVGWLRKAHPLSLGGHRRACVCRENVATVITGLASEPPQRTTPRRLTTAASRPGSGAITCRYSSSDEYLLHNVDGLWNAPGPGGSRYSSLPAHIYTVRQVAWPMTVSVSRHTARRRNTREASRKSDIAGRTRPASEPITAVVRHSSGGSMKRKAGVCRRSSIGSRE